MSTSAIVQPLGYTVPSSLVAYSDASAFSFTTAINNIQYNVLHLNKNLLYQNLTLDELLSSQSSVLNSVQLIDSKLTALDAKVANMQPLVITQSISFLLGAFVALAFVLASKIRY